MRIAVKALVRVAMTGILCWLLAGPALGQADAHPPPLPPARIDDSTDLRVIESTEQGEDPLGIDVATGSGLEEAAKQVNAPAVPLPSAQQGASLSAISQVREESHAVQVELAQGLAQVRTRIGLVSAAKHRAEVSYRLALPRGAVVVALSACRSEKACLKAAPSEAPSAEEYTRWKAQAGSDAVRAQPAPGEALLAEPLRQARGDALALRYASLGPGERVSLEVRYVVEAKLSGGQVFLSLPARGEDPNLAQFAHFELLTPGLMRELPDAFEHDATRPLMIRASLAPAQAARDSVSQARCGAQPCSRRHSAAGPRAYAVRPSWLWIDASPSMEGPARGRVDAVLAALLSALPEETPVRAHAFAARTQALGEFQAGTAKLSQLSDATLLDLDASTQPSHLVAETETLVAREKPRIFLITDGAIDPAATERRALARLEERGAELWILSVGSRAPAAFLPTARTLRVAELADKVLRQGDLSELRAALNAALAPPVRGDGLRAGEQLVRELPPGRGYPLRADSHWLAFWLARNAKDPSWLALSGAPPASEPILPALPYLAAAATEPAFPELTGMPAESVLEMLRTQLVPKARACLRQDRRGRADYAVSLTFSAHFQAREVSEMRVEGNIPEALRTCLSELLPRLRVPAFSGGVRIRYPIHTDRAPVPPVIELTPELRESVQRVIDAPSLRK